MNTEPTQLFAVFGIGAVLLLIIGLYCVIATRNLIRAVIGLVLLTKSVTLLLIIAGNMVGKTALAQALVITVIIVEVVVISVAVGIILRLYQHNRSLDTTLLRNLKG
jgi:multisubunit Na+/H+ antiporter MnhC subunit